MSESTVQSGRYRLNDDLYNRLVSEGVWSVVVTLDQVQVRPSTFEIDIEDVSKPVERNIGLPESQNMKKGTGNSHEFNATQQVLKAPKGPRIGGGKLIESKL